MKKRKPDWAFLWLEYRRIGYVDEMTLFGYRFWYRCGKLNNFLGYEWISKDR